MTINPPARFRISIPYLTAPNMAQSHSFCNASTVSSGKAVPVFVKCSKPASRSMNSTLGIEDPSAWRAAFAPWHVLRVHQMKVMETYRQYFATNAVRRNHANFKALSGTGGHRTKRCSESHASSVAIFSAQPDFGMCMLLLAVRQLISSIARD